MGGLPKQARLVWSTERLGGPAWDKSAELFFSSERISHSLAIYFTENVLWDQAVSAIAAHGFAEETHEHGRYFSTSHRGIWLGPRVLRIRVEGTRENLPPPDGGLQPQLLACVLRSMHHCIEDIATDRQIDDPRDDDFRPEARWGSSKGIPIIRTIVEDTAEVRIEELNYWTGNANTEVCMDFVGPSVVSRHFKNTGSFFVPCGRFRISAVGHAFSFPAYRSELLSYSHAPVFLSNTLDVSLQPGSPLRLSVDLPSGHRVLTAAEAEFFSQDVSADVSPPPEAREALVLTQLS